MVRILIWFPIRIAARAVKHSGKDSNKDHDSDYSEGCEAFW